MLRLRAVLRAGDGDGTDDGPGVVCFREVLELSRYGDQADEGQQTTCVHEDAMQEQRVGPVATDKLGS